MLKLKKRRNNKRTTVARVAAKLRTVEAKRQKRARKYLCLVWMAIEKSDGKKRGKKIKPVELRLQKDIEELDGGKIADISFPDPNNLMKISVLVKPEDGLWNGGKYNFTISVPEMYPHKAPVVHCHTKIYHPNIDLEGHVCLNILRADWKPVLDINACHLRFDLFVL